MANDESGKFGHVGLCREVPTILLIMLIFQFCAVRDKRFSHQSRGRIKR